VAIEHAGLINVLAAQQEVFGVFSSDRVLQFAPLSFDASVFEIFMALGVGGTLCIPDRLDALPGPPLLRFLRQHEVSVIVLPPSTAFTTGAARDLKALRIVALAGERCDGVHLELWGGSGRRFFNLYGPTETTIWSTFQECESTKTDSSLPIGKPIQNVETCVLDRHLNLTPIGVPGELYIGGLGLARGYIGRPELSAERFVAHPRDGERRLYKTGDLVRWRPDGNLEFLGRLDDQIKLRGYRIDLGEIENALRRHPGVTDAAVVIRSTAVSDALEGVVELRADDLDVDKLRGFLSSKLPSYMIPSFITTVTRLPRLPNGKIDRDSIPQNRIR
jgi:amino acid adenylation domain-containing protein